MKAEIGRIIIKERIRKDVTRISELAEDIRENGLLHPVTVMALDDGGFRLLAGLRRIKAVQSMGLAEIEVNVVSPADAEAALRIEVSENEQREPFTFSEKMDYARLLEDIERAKAKERMLAGKSRENSDPVARGPQGHGKSREAIGEIIGMSGRQYDRAKYIADKAPPGVINQLDSGERTIRGTYDELRAKEKVDASPLADDLVDADDDLPAEETVSEPAPQAKTPPKPKTESYRLKGDTVSEDELMKNFSEKDREAFRRLQEFNALPPEGKIAELERRLFDMRVRAVAAESDLATLKAEYGIKADHKDSIIESLKRQNAELNDALDAANARLAELER